MKRDRELICDICDDEVKFFQGENLMLVDFRDEELEKDAPEGVSANDIRTTLIESLERQGSEKHIEFAQGIREKQEFVLHGECLQEMNLPREGEFED